MANLPANFRTTTALDGVSVRYVNDQTKYAALRIFPAFPVPRNVGKFYCYDKQNLRSESLDAPSGTESKRFDYQVTTKSFTCKEKAAKHLVLGKDARDFDKPVADLRQDAALSNMDKLLVEMEVLAVAKCAAGNFAAANKTTLSNPWSGNVGDPIEEVRTARQAVFASSGIRPDCMCINQQSLDYLKNHAGIVDRLKYVGLGALNTKEAVVQAIGNLFELDLIVSDVLKLTSAEGATDATSQIWGSVALVCKKADKVALRSQGFGRTFIVNQLSTKTLNKPELARGDLGAEEIETSMEYTQEFLMQDGSSQPDAGYLISGLY